MLGLRMTRGVADEDFTRMHGLSIRESFGEKLANRSPADCSNGTKAPCG